MAPNAGIIFVKYWSQQRLTDSNALIQAFHYLFDKADKLGKPIVINISMGNHLGPHDGTSYLELYLDKLILEKSGRSIVKSAGNDGIKSIHAEGIVKQNDIVTISFHVTSNNVNDDIISIWYNMNDELEISISSPVDKDIPGISLGNSQSFELENGNIAEIVHQKGSPDQSVNGCVINLKRGESQTIQEGNWSINIRGKNIINGQFDMWIEKINNSQPYFFGISNANQKCISIPGTSHHIISVGNYETGNSININSSIGPTRDNRIKPDISAPGTEIFSTASSQFYKESTKYVSLSGTSMAAPTVTGIIALMLDLKPSLTNTMIKEILVTSTRKNFSTDKIPNNIWGYGQIDALLALNYTMKI
jgi:subtilisin family serine protease